MAILFKQMPIAIYLLYQGKTVRKKMANKKLHITQQNLV